MRGTLVLLGVTLLFLAAYLYLATTRPVGTPFEAMWTAYGVVISLVVATVFALLHGPPARALISLVWAVPLAILGLAMLPSSINGVLLAAAASLVVIAAWQVMIARRHSVAA